MRGLSDVEALAPRQIPDDEAYAELERFIRTS